MPTRRTYAVRDTRAGAARSMLAMSLAAFAFGCSFEPAPLHYFSTEGAVYVSPDFSDEQTDVIVAALASWSEATAGSVALQARIGDGSPQIRPVRERDGIIAEFIPSERPEIVLDTMKAANAEALRSVTLHELGHAFGLQHIEQIDSVMFPLANTVRDLDPWTIAAWHALYPKAEPSSTAR